MSAANPHFIVEAKTAIAELDKRAAAIVEDWNLVQAERNKWVAFLEILQRLAPTTDAEQSVAEMATDDPLLAFVKTAKLADGIEKILAEKGQHGCLKVSEIFSWLRRAGRASLDNKKASSAVIKTMQRYPSRFYNPTRGIWGLASRKQSEPLAPITPIVGRQDARVSDMRML